jgi:hypothetical protein
MPPDVLVAEGSKLRGERIRVVAREIADPRLSATERSSSHKRKFTVARGSVVCTIEQAARYVYEHPEARSK